MEGLFSIKSDVYSFGVLTLEIISGQRNNSFHRSVDSPNLVGHVRTELLRSRNLFIKTLHFFKTHALYQTEVLF